MLSPGWRNGRRARLKIVCRKACGFDSHPGHITMPNNFIIRKAKMGDLPQILSLNLELFKKEFGDFDRTLDLNWTRKSGKKYFKDQISSRNGFLEVVEHNNRLVGYLCGGLSDVEPYRTVKKPAELENMIIKKRFRSMGLGRTLTNNFLKWCKENGVDRVFVMTSHANLRGINFYKNNGFKDHDLMLERKIK